MTKKGLEHLGNEEYIHVKLHLESGVVEMVQTLLISKKNRML